MAGDATIVSAGSVTISATGSETGNAFDLVANLLRNAGGNFVVPTSASSVTEISAPKPSVPGGVFVLASGYSGGLVLPTGYAAVVLDAGTAVTVSGGDSATAIVSAGKLDYDGNSSAVTALGDGSALIDTGINANIAIGGKGVVVTLGGAGQSLRLDGGAQGKFTEAGRGANITLSPLAAGAPGSVNNAVTTPTVPSPSVFDLTTGTTLALQDASAGSVVVLRGGADTVSASAGINTVYATTGNDVYFEGAAQTTFVGATGSVVAVSTVFGGTGNDTVFAQAGLNYTEGSGNNLFTGGRYADLLAQGGTTVSAAAASHSTVTATTGHDLLFGGTVGDQYNLGNGSEVFVGGGGADTMFGGSVAPTIFGGSNESLKLIGTNAGIVVAGGNNDLIDASKANQGSTFFVSNVAGVLNTTLVGSTAAPVLTGAHDTFVVGANPTVTAAGVAHVVTIDNFHTGDAFFLTGYTAADGAAFTAAVATPLPNGNVSFTLSDKTTVTFVGSHPTGVFDGGKDAL